MNETQIAASACFEVVMRNRPWWKRASGWAVTLLLADNQGAGPTVPAWSQDAVVRDRSTGQVLGVVRNGVGSADDLAGQVRADVATMSAAEFRSRWLDA